MIQIKLFQVLEILHMVHSFLSGGQILETQRDHFTVLIECVILCARLCDFGLRHLLLLSELLCAIGVVVIGRCEAKCDEYGNYDGKRNHGFISPVYEAETLCQTLIRR